jgi:hypothetical protein
MPKHKVRLHATQESDEANFGANRYRVDNNGDVDVDEEAVEALVAKGGFILDPAPPVEVPHGNIRVQHVSDPAAMCAHRGMEFALESDGSVIVPIEAVEHLRAHGFHPVPEVIAPVAEPVAPVEQLAPEPVAEPIPEPAVVAPVAGPAPEQAPEDRASAP